ncbi:MAG: membrane protein insertase YidC [Eubacterium sp.]|nr:membrane protein insertase YidC [Eubacterium sp.]
MILTQSSGFLLGNLSKLLGWVMNGIYNLFNNMGVVSIALSIIVFTVIIRLAMFPLSIKTTRSGKIQNFLRPEFQKITKKYKGKKDNASVIAQQKETRELQKKYGIKMSAGCLTALIQLPIFLSLYNVIQNIPAYVGKIYDLYAPIANAMIKVEGAHDTLAQFITDNKITRVTLQAFDHTINTASDAGKSALNSIIDVLAKCGNDFFEKLKVLFGGSPDVVNAINANQEKIVDSNQFILGINLSEAPGWAWTWALIIPISAFLFQFLSMKVTPQQSTGDPQQDAQMKSMRRFMLVMPVMSFFVTISVPAGLGLYWAVSALVSVLITLATNFYYDHADMEAIVEKARVKAERKMERQKARRGGKEKKSFLDKMQEAAGGQSSGASEEESAGMRQYGSARLKNYTSSTSYKDRPAENSNAKYKPGSLASKANALRDYNEKGDH